MIAYNCNLKALEVNLEVKYITSFLKIFKICSQLYDQPAQFIPTHKITLRRTFTWNIVKGVRNSKHRCCNLGICFFWGITTIVPESGLFDFSSKMTWNKFRISFKHSVWRRSHEVLMQTLTNEFGKIVLSLGYITCCVFWALNR